MTAVFDLSETKIAQFKERFVNREDFWYRQNTLGKYVATGVNFHEPMSVETVRKIISGELSCAIPALDANGMCKWAAWDWDHETDVLDKIEKALKTVGFHPLREGRREGRSGHCWLFFTEPVSATELLIFDDWIRDQLQIDEPALEFFPKQSSPAKIGNGLRMPLSRNLKPDAKGARGWFDGVEHDVSSQVRFFLDQPLSDAGKLRAIFQGILKKMPPKFEIIRIKRKTDFDVWDYVGDDYRMVSTEYVAQCPVCANEGHDNHNDNLHILSDESFICMFGTPGKTHSRQQIIDAFLKRR